MKFHIFHHFKMRGGVQLNEGWRAAKWGGGATKGGMACKKVKNLYLGIAESVVDTFDFGIVVVPIPRLAQLSPANGAIYQKKQYASEISRCLPTAGVLKHRQTAQLWKTAHFGQKMRRLLPWCLCVSPNAFKMLANTYMCTWNMLREVIWLLRVLFGIFWRFFVENLDNPELENGCR